MGFNTKLNENVLVRTIAELFTDRMAIRNACLNWYERLNGNIYYRKRHGDPYRAIHFEDRSDPDDMWNGLESVEFRINNYTDECGRGHQLILRVFVNGICKAERMELDYESPDCPWMDEIKEILDFYFTPAAYAHDVKKCRFMVNDPHGEYGSDVIELLIDNLDYLEQEIYYDKDDI